MALTLNALSTHANDIAVKVEQPTSDAIANVEITTRLGKFGPMATITMPKFRLGAREEKIVGHTDTGVPVTERKHNLIEAGRAIASEWEADYEKRLKAGEVEPIPKAKTQAEEWEEENARILAREKVEGRVTTKRFIVPGMTPEASLAIQERDRTATVVMKKGSAHVVSAEGVEVPVRMPIALAEENPRETPEKYREGAVNQGDESMSPNNASLYAPFEDLNDLKGMEISDSNVFPDLNVPLDVKSEVPIPVSLFKSNNLLTDRLTTFVGFITGSFEAEASPTGVVGDSTVTPDLKPNSMMGQFDAIANEIAKGKKAIDQTFSNNSHSKAPEHHDTQNTGPTHTHNQPDADAFDEFSDPFSLAEGVENCSQCQLTDEDFDRVAAVAEGKVGESLSSKMVLAGQEAHASYEATKKVLKETEKDVEVGAGIRSTISSIVALLGDPNHPSSLLSIMRQAFLENRSVEEVVPDASARLGLTKSFEGDSLTSEAGKHPANETYIFISGSMGDEAIRRTFKRNLGRKDVSYFVRGVPEGMSLGEGIKHLQALAAEFDPVPIVMVDLTAFRYYGVNAVPAVVKVAVDEAYFKQFTLEEKMKGPQPRRHPSAIASVFGLNNDSWLDEQIDIDQCTAKDPCRYGEQGPLFAIDEPDMVEEMKRRVMAIDWEKKKREAIKRFWTNQVFDELPTATVSAHRHLDPTIHVVNDINDANGNPIRRAGDVVNPLSLRPFTSTLVVFNPKREDEIALVKAEVARRQANGEGHFIYMATAFDTSERSKDKALGAGWGHFKAVTDALDSHVFLLTPEVKERWDICVTPTFITADNEKKVFVIDEMAPNGVVPKHVSELKHEAQSQSKSQFQSQFQSQFKKDAEPIDELKRGGGGQ